jgi:hypothetical protein
MFGSSPKLAPGFRWHLSCKLYAVRRIYLSYWWKNQVRFENIFTCRSYGYKITCTDLWLNKGTSSKGDFLLLRSLKQNLGDHRLEDDWEVKTVITAWLIAHGMDWYRHGTEKLVSQCDKGFSYCWDYVETQWHSLAIKFWTVFFFRSPDRNCMRVLWILVWWTSNRVGQLVFCLRV